MDAHSKNILKTFRWASFVLTVVAAVAYFLFGDDPRLQRWAMSGEQLLVLSLVVLFSYVLVALAWQFASDLMRPGQAASSGVLLALHGHRGAAFIAMLAAAFLVTLGFSLALLPQAVLEDLGFNNPFKDFEFHIQAMFALLGAIGIFLVIVFASRVLVNPPWFLLTREGFLYAPGGVSPGVVRWSDVQEIRESWVLSYDDNGQGKTAMKPTLVVSLKQPDKYLTLYTPMLRLFVHAALKVLRVQTRGGDIYIDATDFGQRQGEIVAKMRELAGLPAPTQAD